MRQSAVIRAANRYTRVALPHSDEVLDAFRTLGVLVGGIVRLTVPVEHLLDRHTPSGV